jgi:hypothetical protein
MILTINQIAKYMSFFVKSEATHLPHYILDHSCLLGIAGTKECNKVKKK